MSGGGALNLSLLSRGIGEVSRNGNEKVDVIFEPQDYFNFVENHQRSYFLPPIEPHYGFSDGNQLSSRYMQPKEKVYLPKTFTTRKGALLLFSEDMAHRTRYPMAMKHRPTAYRGEGEAEESGLTNSSLDQDLRTVDDLAKCILSYGSHLSHDNGQGKANFKFMHKKRRDYFDRQIRPGFSAKRYLSTWTKSWDDTVLEKVISKGYLTEKSLFYYNPLLPHLSRRLNDDLSHHPAPYRLMRSMLMSPGSLSGYTFYRVRPESQETDYEPGEEDGRTTAHSVKMVSVKDGVPLEVDYGDLDHKIQKEVLTDLLVKSAVHYALKTQQVHYGLYMTLLLNGRCKNLHTMFLAKEYVSEYPDKSIILEEGTSVSEPMAVPTFDMQNAVESLLQNQHLPRPRPGGPAAKTLPAAEQDLPDLDARSQVSGSFRGVKRPTARQHPPIKDKAPGDIVSVTMRERDPDRDDSRSTSPSSTGLAGRPMLPPIGQTYSYLTPIGEASREHTQAYSVLPPGDKDGETSDSEMPGVNLIPATPQHSTLSNEAIAPAAVIREPQLEMQEEEEEGWMGQAVTERDLAQRQREAEERRRQEMDRRRTKIPQKNIDLEGPIAVGGAGVMSSSESLGPASTHSSGWQAPAPRQQWRGSTQSLRSSRKASVYEHNLKHEDTGAGSPEAEKGKNPRTIVVHVGPMATSLSPTRLASRSTAQSLATTKSRSSSAVLPSSPPASVQTVMSGSLVGGEKDEPSSHHGSIVFGPDGEIIPVGGTIRPYIHPSQSVEDVHDTNLAHMQRDTSDDSDAEMPDEWKDRQRQASQKSESVKQYGSKREIDLRSGDIDATVSMHGWCYGPRDGDSELHHAESLRSLPTLSIGPGSSTSQVTEQEIIDTLTSHASRIAENVLSQNEAGQLLEEDIRRAASLWTDTHPARTIARSQSVQDVPDKTVIDQVMLAQKRKSAGPTVAEYRDKIKDNLMVAIAKVAGVNQADIPEDADIDPALMEALASGTLSPEDIEIVRDDAGRSYIRSRSGQIAEARGDVSRGHIFVPASRKPGETSVNRRVSIPADRVTTSDMEPNIINYVTQEEISMSDKSSSVTSSDKLSSVKSPSIKAPSEKAPSEKAPSEKVASEPGSDKRSVRTRSPVKSLAAESIPEDASWEPRVTSGAVPPAVASKEEVDEFQKAIRDLEKSSLPSKKSDSNGGSMKSGKSDNKKSKVPDKTEKKEEFVVGKVHQKKELEDLYGQTVEVPPRVEPLPPGKPKVIKKEKEIDKAAAKKKKKASKKDKPVKEPEELVEVETTEVPDEPAMPEEDREKQALDRLQNELAKLAPPKPSAVGPLDHIDENKEIYGMPPNAKPHGDDGLDGEDTTSSALSSSSDARKGKPKEKKPKAPPAPKKEVKKGKKGVKKGAKKKEEDQAEPQTAMETVSPVKAPSPERKTPKSISPRKESSPKTETPDSDRYETPDYLRSEDEDEEDFVIIREATESPEPIVEKLPIVASPEPEQDDEASEQDKLRMISNRDARVVKRAAAADKRRLDVERKRREREEQMKKEKEEAERQEKLKLELDEQRRLKEEERRLRKQRESEEQDAEANEERERERRKQAEIDRERRRKEEYARRLDDMKRRQAEEDARRKEEAELKRLEEEERRKEELAMLETMQEQDRRDYERRKREEEAERARKEEEDRIRREEEAQKALEEARRLAEEMARRQAELEARLRFNRTLQLESNGMEHSQDITKAFVFSYFELLQWLGLDIPEFELLKLNQY